MGIFIVEITFSTRKSTMKIPMLSTRQFNKLKKFLPVPRGNKKLNDRIFLSCCIWIIRTGFFWSEIPDIYGKYDSMRKKFSRWSKAGIFRKIFSSFAIRCGKRNIVMIDSTFSKAHRTASSLKSDGKPRQIGKSKGGFTTKIHMIANIEEKPLDFELTGGQVNDSKEGTKIIGANLYRMKGLLGDKAYDTNQIRAMLTNKKIKVCIPTKSNRKNKIPYDKELYKKRGKIENMFGRLKDWLGIALRRCRCAHIFDSFVCLALTMTFFCVR